MSVVSYTLPPTTRDVGFKGSAPTAISKAKPAPRNASNGGGDALLSLDGPDEKLEDGDELSKSYIPLSLARAKMAVLTTELANMKSKHLTLIDEIAQRYEKMTLASRAHFEGIVDEVKARASLRLKENKATMEELREEIVLIQEAQAQKNAQYRQEIKAAVKEQGRLQQELLDAQNEATSLQKRHEEESVRFEQRKAEMEALMDRVPREEHVALQNELTELQQKQAAESASAAEKIAALEQEAQDNKSALEALNVTHLSLQEQYTASAAALAAKEDELARARTEVEDTKAALAAAESQVSAGDESTKAMQERLTEQEARAATLETQLLTAQALVGTGGGSSGSGGEDGPARLVMIPDPELQSNVRRLEGEMNKLLRENADLTRVLLEREEAVAASNEALVKAKTLGTQTSIRLASGAAAAASLGGEDEDEEEVTEEIDAPSEYEDQDVEEPFEEEVSVPAPASASDEPGSPAPVDPRREALVSQLAEADSTLSAHGASIAALERELKPKVVDYKTRLAEFKGDTERKELEASLGYDRIVEEDGSEHELRPADLTSLQSMLALNEAVATQKPILAARVLVLRPRKKELDDNKVLLSDLKNTISELKAAGTDPDAVKAKEAEFMALRNSMQADATAFRDEYADYGAKLNELKAQESELQALFVKFKVDPEHAEDKPRKLGADKMAQIQRLIDLINNKGKERDALKALAEEVNTKNTQLKALKAEREAAQTTQKTLQAELDELPPPPASSSASSSAASGATVKVKRMSTRTVTKRVKLPPRKQIVTRKVKKAGGSRSAAASSSSATGEAHVPATLLNSLKPIHLRDKGKYTAREFTPVTPTVFKAPTHDAAGAGSPAPSSSSSSASSGSDPALQAKYDNLTARASKLEAELDTLRQSSSHSADALAAKENELSQLREQIRILTEENPDERVSALAAQLAQQRAEVDATHQAHASRLAEVAATGSAARAELATKADEVAKLKSEVQSLKEKVRNAKAEAKANAANGGGGGGGAAIAVGGGGGGADPALVAELEGKVSALEESLESTTTERDAHLASISSLQARIVELEAEVAAHTGSLSEQLAAREAELTAAHAARISELEAQITESTEKLRITKKKAKELHEALTAETAKREGLETNVTELTATIAGMETETAEARASVAGLKGEIAKREGVIETKVGEINGLLEEKSKLEGEVAFLAERNAEEVKRRKEFQFKYEDAKGKVRVYARVRPFSKQEIKDEEKTLLRPGTNEWTLCINETQKNYQGIVTDNWRPIEFDHVFQFGLENSKGNASQAEIFEETKIFAELAVQGINCCVFAYGQSGTGKTFTMAGIKPSEANGHTRELLGLKPRMIERVYEMKQQLRKTHDISISCYMLEIYLNHLEDVFWKLQTQQKYAGKEKSKWPEPPELKVRVDAKRKVTVDNSVILQFETAAEMQEFCDAAEMTRRVRKTGLNEESSRSHLIFALICTSTDKKTGKKTTGKLSLVDLAGSERAEKTSVEGLSKAARAAMMEEGIAINESLRMLKSVFRILGEANKPLAKGQKAEIVQYRGNMLTELMQDSLGGNAKTLMFVNVGPAASNISESVDSLAYGDLVKNITNEKVSADADLEEQLRFLQVQLRAYEAKFGALDA